MNAFTEFLSMGGYAFYVWTSYGLVAVVLLGNLISAATKRHRLVRELTRRERMGIRRKTREAV